MIFWFSIAVITVVIALICFYPLLKRKEQHQENVERDALNKALYFDRLQEVERDEAQGLLDNAAQLKTELQQALLEDIPAEQTADNKDKKRFGGIWFTSGLLALAIIGLATYFSVGSWQAENMLEKTYEKLPHFYERLKEEETHPLSETEQQQFITALRLHLQKSPDDAAGWWLLGQLAMSMDKGQLAHDSYARAYKLSPENTDYKMGFARILMFSDDASDKFKGEELLKEVLRQDHTNFQALSLLAFHYFEKEDYKMAAVTWAMMLRLLPENDPRVPLLEKSIRSARDALEEQEAPQSK
ncbi:c-type cytochrome biogenesis protein CcmI [Conservatibacter flavescens]|uniref:C-type cytochrome biogenesis protein CcmI n=1 Tax=Conservatibacter flavescens TaxID=28161 RepID=A0A2M8S2F2_9PAST|nr:c-type cytochrome biogenesis protein CcmI [Conservatibacter flavescens]PJG85296.1 c-type cytochrome biogenesis protein CcmI [Conservatibacter flavescens]